MGVLFPMGMIGMLFFIWRGRVVSYPLYKPVLFWQTALEAIPCSGEDRYDSRLQILCGDRSGCERHFLIIAASRCPVSYACNIWQPTYYMTASARF